MMNGLIQLLSSYGIPYDFIIKATFYSIAGLTVLFALFVVLSRHIFHAAVYLAVVLISIACIYLYLDAEFLAVVQVLIYVGAIVTLFIFTVMLTADIDSGTFVGTLRRMLVSALASLAIFFILVKVINMVTAWKTVLSGGSSVSLSQLGKSLMSGYALPFEVISLISLAAMIGAIVIGKAEKR
jgi:NADH:ubiquinone oxidoreductase subunit 6 (subunit J)